MVGMYWMYYAGPILAVYMLGLYWLFICWACTGFYMLGLYWVLYPGPILAVINVSLYWLLNILGLYWLFICWPCTGFDMLGLYWLLYPCYVMDYAGISKHIGKQILFFILFMSIHDDIFEVITSNMGMKLCHFSTMKVPQICDRAVQPVQSVIGFKHSRIIIKSL